MGAVRNAVTEGLRSRSLVGPARMTPGHLLVLERRSEPGERRVVGVLRRRGVADDKGRSANVVAERVAAEALDSQATDGGVLDNLVFLLAAGKFQDCVQAGGDPCDPHSRCVLGKRGDEPVATLPVGEPGPADVPVVGPEVMNSASVSCAMLVCRRRPGG